MIRRRVNSPPRALRIVGSTVDLSSCDDRDQRVSWAESWRSWDRPDLRSPIRMGHDAPLLACVHGKGVAGPDRPLAAFIMPRIQSPTTDDASVEPLSLESTRHRNGSRRLVTLTIPRIKPAD